MEWAVGGDEGPKGLTDANAGQQPHCNVWLFAVWEDWFNNVVCKGEGDDGLRTRTDDDALDPKAEKGEERSEGFVDVGVVSAGLDDHAPEFSEAVGSDHGEESAQDPHDERQSHGSRLFQHSFRTDEDPGSDDAAHDHRDPVQEGDLRFQVDGVVLGAIRVNIGSLALDPAVPGDGAELPLQGALAGLPGPDGRRRGLGRTRRTLRFRHLKRMKALCKWFTQSTSLFQ